MRTNFFFIFLVALVFSKSNLISQVWVGDQETGTTNTIVVPDADLLIQSGVEHNTIFGSSLMPNSVGINVAADSLFNGDTTLYGLDVRGDINISDANWYASPTQNYLNHGYRIGGVTVLQTQRQAFPPYESRKNIFVGEYAGFTWSSLDNAENGIGNTYVGYKAGFNTQDSDNNTCIGSEAGAFAGLHHSVIIGERAGVYGNYNSSIIIGQRAIGNYYNSSKNFSNEVIIGSGAGYFLGGNNSSNVVIGSSAVFNGHKISENVIIGESASSNANNISKNVIVGK